MIIQGILILGGAGLILGLILGIVNKKVSVEVDPLLNEIIETLPGANCGACGYAGCAGCGEAILNKIAPVNACPVGGAPCAEALGKLLGVDSGATERKIARVMCNGGTVNAKSKLIYTDAGSCHLIKHNFHGNKLCDSACYGEGSCASACTFGAIKMVDGLPVVNEKKCTSCGACVSECPQDLMELVPYRSKVFVTCKNIKKGKPVLEACDVGCIKCKKCEKACNFDAIHVTDVARIDYDKCVNCKACTKVCPRNIILVDERQNKVSVYKKEAKKCCVGCDGCE